MPRHGATAGLCKMCAAGVRAMKTVQTSIESLCSELCGIGSLDGHAFREGAEHGAVSAIASGLVRRFGDSRSPHAAGQLHRLPGCR
jgi:hypothetical protein